MDLQLLGPEMDLQLGRAVGKCVAGKWRRAPRHGRCPARSPTRPRLPPLASPHRRKHNTEADGYRKPWTPDEDLRLRDLVMSKGTQQWAQIAQEMPDRNGKQCRERWHNQLNNDLSVSAAPGRMPRARTRLDKRAPRRAHGGRARPVVPASSGHRRPATALFPRATTRVAPHPP